MKPFPRVLLWNLPDTCENGRLLAEILSGLSCEAIMLEPSMLGKTVGYLAGLEGYTDADAEHITEHGFNFEFMLMCHADQRWLEEYLSSARSRGLKITRKAVMTKINREWSLHRLIREIDLEHMAMTLKSLLITARATENPSVGLLGAQTRAEKVISNREPDPAEISNAFNDLKRALESESGGY